jgi:membrane protein DedA with SNARE-associated domain
MQSLSINVIRHFVETYAVWAYVFIAIGVIVEGEVAVILAGIFSHLGSLNPIIAFFSAIVGGASKSIFGYSIGLYLQRNHSHRPFLGLVERRISYFFPHFQEKPFWSIFISRFFILGVGLFTIIFSGYKKIALKIFIKAEALSLILWSIVMLALGYFFSYTALSISRDVRKFLGIILLFFLAFFLLEKIIGFFIGIFEELSESKQNE